MASLPSGEGCGPCRSLTLEVEGNGMSVQDTGHAACRDLRPGVGASGGRHLQAPAGGS